MWRPGASRGVDLNRLSADFPRLIWTSLTPFGLSGPYSAYVGNNIVAEAMGGLMYIQGDDTRPPCVSPYEQGMHLASLHAAFGTLSALWERRASGCGQVVEVSAQEVLAQIYYVLVRYSYGKDILRRTGARNPQPANGYYRCQDGHIFLSLFQPHQWDRLVELMQDPVLLEPAFRDRDYQLAHADIVEAHIQQFAARFDRWTLTEALQRRGLPAAPVSTIADLAANVHLAARHFFRDIEQPPWGRLRSPGPLFRACRLAYACAAASAAPRGAPGGGAGHSRSAYEHGPRPPCPCGTPLPAAHRDSYPGPQSRLGWTLWDTLPRRLWR